MKSNSTLFLTIITIILSVTVSKAQTGWAWMTGKNGTNGMAVYGTLGVADSANTPAALYESNEWTDLQGNFWLFGGRAYSPGVMNTFWKFDPTTLKWTWMGGNQICCQKGIYGIQGVPNPANFPGSREWGGATWTDLNGNLWLFGGSAYDKNGTLGDMNDLWRYNIATKEWTWMKGSSTTGAVGVYGTQGIPSPANTPPPMHEMASRWVGPDGNLWLFGGYYSSGYNHVWRYDIATNEWTWMKGSTTEGAADVYGTMGIPAPANTPGGRACYCKWADQDGNYWLFGGYSNMGPKSDLWKYDVGTNQWTWMSGTTGVNGNGSYSSICNAIPSNLPMSRYENRANWTDGNQRLWMFGGAGGSASTALNDLWYYDIATGIWNWVNGSSSGNQNALYGPLGVHSTSYHPGAATGSVSWIDQECHLWLLGGVNFSNNSYYNSMWKFIPDEACVGTVCSPVLLPPSAAFAVNDSAFCEATCIDFTDQSSGNPTAWQWSFPGAVPSSSTAKNPTDICYYIPGSYDVTLIATNAAGSDTIVFTNLIFINNNPSVSISQSNDTLYSTSGNSYQWYSGAGSINGATDNYYVAGTEGYYSVIITDSNGCTAADTIYFSLAPQSNLSAADTLICQKFCMDFLDLSGNNPTSWKWTFEGGSPSTSTAKNPVQICYNQPGNYDVTLITTNSYGSDTMFKNDYIHVIPTPASPVITQNGNVLTSSLASSYQWQFNSVDIPGATNQTYMATETGFYSVIIGDESGCVSAATVYVVVSAIDEIYDATDIRIYPNPNNGNFMIERSGESIADFNITVINVHGQIVYQSAFRATSFNKEMDLSFLPSSTYLVKIIVNEKQFLSTITIKPN